MSKTYIDREAALNKLRQMRDDYRSRYNGAEAAAIAEYCRDALIDIPTVDVAANPQWISVEERLPEHEYGESTSVLTVDLYGVMRVTYFDGGNWCWPSGEALTTMRVAPITHWMPLPAPPKEVTQHD